MVTVERLLVRDRPAMTLRVRLGPKARGSSLPSFATVEWVGLAGHPSSYGMLTGARSDTSRLAIADEGGARFRDSLAANADTVLWGLPDEYRSAVVSALDDEVQGALVSQAAHGEVGSSRNVFTALTHLLCRVLAGGLPDNDEDVWRLLDKCWQA